MARRAVKTTYMYEDVAEGLDHKIRRLVVAGQFIPDGLVEGEDTEPDSFVDESGPRKVGFGAAAPEYKHNVDNGATEALETAKAKGSGKAAAPTPPSA
jgi:hypothetical protein